MRLWSIHPSFLDSKGLVALWREGLLARHVLLGKTKGYTHHPQLDRFKLQPNPVKFLDMYLKYVAREANRRRYKFDESKLGPEPAASHLGTIPVTSGQLEYEFAHLLLKLHDRDHDHIKTMSGKELLPHPLFHTVPGWIEPWEKVTKETQDVLETDI